MMELKMEIYTPSLELVGILEVFQSVQWEEFAFKAGSFSVESLTTDTSKSLLRPENIIWIEGGTAGIIESIQERAGDDGPYISAKGHLLSGILDRRILWGTYDLYGGPAALMYHLADDCAIHPTRGDTEARKIPCLELGDYPESDRQPIRKQKTGGSAAEAMEELGQASQVAYGIRFIPQPPQMEFEARPGTNRTIHQTENEPVFYSTELDDVLTSEYSYNSSEYKNVALVAGEGEGANRVMVTVEGDSGRVENPETPSTSVRFVPKNSASLTTQDSKIFISRSSSSESENYYSSYTGTQIDGAVKRVLDGDFITKQELTSAIQSAILDSWEASY